VIVELNSESFEREALNSIRPCIVKFYNTGCHLCAGLTPVFARLHKKYGQQMKFATMDTWNHGEVADQYLDGGIPTIRIFLKGYPSILVEYPEEPSPYTGYPEDYLDKWIYNCLLSYLAMEANKRENG